jgi:hypothetical protein
MNNGIVVIGLIVLLILGIALWSGCFKSGAALSHRDDDWGNGA